MEDAIRANEDLLVTFEETRAGIQAGYARVRAELGMPPEAFSAVTEKPASAADPWTAWRSVSNHELNELLDTDIGALQDAWLGVDDVGDATVKGSAAWQNIGRLWNQMRDLAVRANEGALRFENDADTFGAVRALWLRGCEVLSHDSRTLMRQLEGEGKKESLGWHAVRLLHHAAEQAIAHVRGFLPADETAPLGTYDQSTTIASGRISSPAESGAATGDTVPRQTGPEDRARSAAAAAGFPAFLAQRMKATGSGQMPGSAVPGRGPVPRTPDSAPEAGR